MTLKKVGYLKEATTFDVPAFAIAKYPITNAQFAVFVKAPDGYGDAHWWDYSDAAQQLRAKNPQLRETLYSGDNLPRTNVRWMDAVAFCRWLDSRVGARRDASLILPLQITLPSEQKWQRAAQGDDRRTYPWGNEFDTEKTNTRKSGIGKPTPVTQYPQGASPYGVMDMSGNVWEWCLMGSKTGISDINETEKHVLRGGSFNHDPDFAACVYRDPIYMLKGSDRFGFRVCLSSPNSS